MAAALGIYLAVLAPVAKIEAERSYLTALTDRLNEEMVTVLKTPNTSFGDGVPALAKASKASREAFAGLSRIKQLPKANLTIRNALGVITNLQQICEKRRKVFNDNISAVQAQAQKAFDVTDSLKPIFFFTADTNVYKTKLDLIADGKIMAVVFLNLTDTMAATLKDSIDTIDQNLKVIDAQITSIRASAIRFALIIGFLVVLGASFMALVFARSIARSIVSIGISVSSLKEGDLTARSDVALSDEVGSLAADLNATLDLLALSFGEIKSVSKANIEVKDRLVAAAGEASSASTQIETNARSIDRQFQTLNAHVELSSNSVGKIVGAMGDLDREISDEGSMVERVTASVTEMLASLENMSKITTRDRESSGKLVVEAGRGSEVFASATMKIAEIPESIGSIQAMAKVIQGIASRTNLLAMNAAIEAAHAGDAGAGFAVVADEIRTLSEASTRSSKEIAQSIKAIIEKIGLATDANSSISEAFAIINGRISEVSASMDELYASIGEIQAGSKDILEAMTELRDRSLKVQAGSSAVRGGSAEISGAMADLSRISSEVTSNIGEITAGITDIHASIDQVASYAERVGVESARLDTEVNRFRTES